LRREDFKTRAAKTLSRSLVWKSAKAKKKLPCLSLVLAHKNFHFAPSQEFERKITYFQQKGGKRRCLLRKIALRKI